MNREGASAAAKFVGNISDADIAAHVRWAASVLVEAKDEILAAIVSARLIGQIEGAAAERAAILLEWEKVKERYVEAVRMDTLRDIILFRDKEGA